MKVGKGDARQAEIGSTSPARTQGSGYAAEAVLRLLDCAFGKVDLHRVVATTDQRNEPSSRLLERLGMRREGSVVRAAWFKGEWASEYLYAVLGKSGWEKRRREPGVGSPRSPSGSTPGHRNSTRRVHDRACPVEYIEGQNLPTAMKAVEVIETG